MVNKEICCLPNTAENCSLTILSADDALQTKYAFYKLSYVCNAKKIQVLAWLQIVKAVFGIVLNTFVIIVFAKRKKIHDKVGNILLVTQATADLYNTSLNAIPFAFYYLTMSGIYFSVKREGELIYTKITTAFFAFSFYSSQCIFTLISIERYLSVTKPIWHRTNVTKRSILRSLLVVIIFAAVLTSTWFASPKGDVIINPLLPLLILMIVLKFVWTIVVSIFFAITYMKMRHYLGPKIVNKGSHNRNQEQGDHIEIKKRGKENINR